MSEKFFSKKYEVKREIACGGMGTIYLATDTKLGRDVAIKMLHPQYSGEPAFAQRFLREAWAMAKLDHPNIIRIWSVEEEEQSHCIVMEYFPGQDLKHLIRSRGPLPLAESLAITTQIIQGLAYAHYMGIIHRDIKPANILVDQEGTVKITDFGIAAAFSESSLTVDGTVMGTPEYMAPEQARAEPVGAHTDLYSVGILLYELLTGQTPYKGIPAQSLVAKLAFGSDNPVLTFPQSIPDEVQTLIRHMTHQRVEDRLTDIKEILRITKSEVFAPALPPSDTEETAVFTSDKTFTATDLLPNKPGTQIAPVSTTQPTNLSPGPSNQPELKKVVGNSLEEKPYLIDNAQFTTFRPRTIESNKWYNLLVFAHLSEPLPDSSSEQPTPLEKVQKLAEQTLGATIDQYGDIAQDSAYPIPQEGELTIVPSFKDIIVNPPQASFLWLEPVHQEIFRMKASPGITEETVRGNITIFLGSLILAEMQITIKVVPTNALSESPSTLALSVKPYRSIFASYSHKDSTIVHEFERHVKATGDQYLMDCLNLRAGQRWKPRLIELIEQADIFQLFWSKNAMNSEIVEQEWRYATSLARPYFIRPVYWESPFPESGDGSKPAPELRKLHFQRVFPSHHITSQSPDNTDKAQIIQNHSDNSSESIPASSKAHLPAEPSPLDQKASFPILKTLSGLAAVILIGVNLYWNEDMFMTSPSEQVGIIEDMGEDTTATAGVEAPLNKAAAEAKHAEQQRLAALEAKRQQALKGEQQERKAKAAEEARQKEAARLAEAQGQQEQELLKKILINFMTAYENRDLLNLKLTTAMSESRTRNLDLMFQNYTTITAHTKIISTSETQATAKIFIDELINKEGERITPNFIVRETTITIPKKDGKWGKIQW